MFLDSESIDHNYNLKKGAIEKLLSNSDTQTIVQRTLFDVNHAKLSRIKTSEQSLDAATTKMFEKQIFRRPLTIGETKFVHLMLRHSCLLKKYINSFIENAAYITENSSFLEKYLSKPKSLGLIHFFPYVRIVNLDQALEILDINAKSQGLYLGTRSKTALTPWYQIYLYTKSTYLPVIYKNSIRYPSKKPSQTIQALIFRLLKALFCIDYLGIQHYFGHSRKATFDVEKMNKGLDDLKSGSSYPEGMGVLIDLDDLLVIFYHIEYLISMVTGIFDNLAIETVNRYKIVGIPSIRISLSNSTGKELLKEVNNLNPDLKIHIDANRPFINMIYEFRQKVIHREGLERIISPIGPHWSNLIVINHQIKEYINQCGDKASLYKILSKWGIIERNMKIYLDPYYFSKHVVNSLIPFADKYLQLLGYNSFINKIDSSDAFVKDLEYFKTVSLRV